MNIRIHYLHAARRRKRNSSFLKPQHILLAILALGLLCAALATYL